jgi:hypothetical protein
VCVYFTILPVSAAAINYGISHRLARKLVAFPYVPLVHATTATTSCPLTSRLPAQLKYSRCVFAGQLVLVVWSADINSFGMELL